MFVVLRAQLAPIATLIALAVSALCQNQAHAGHEVPAGDRPQAGNAAGAIEEAADDPRAVAVLQAIDDLWRGSSSHAQMRMEVRTEHYERTMQLEAWSKGRDKTLVRILAPAREKGTSTLRMGGDMYTYLPRTDRVIRLTSGMMGGAWMGSHFTHDDLVKMSRLQQDYSARLTFDGERDGTRLVELELLPRPKAAVVWGKLKVIARADDYIPVEQLFYDERGSAIRTMQFSNIRVFDGRKVAATLRVIPFDRRSESTTVTYENLDFDVDLHDLFFSVQRLRQRR